MKKFAVLLVFLTLSCFLLSDAFAERTSATPITGETITIFGTEYTVEGIDLVATFGLDSTFAGFGCGWKYGGPDPSNDLILLADEFGSGGEDTVILTGVNAASLEPNATDTTMSYIYNDNDGSPNTDPSGIEWIDDDDTGSPNSDANIRLCQYDSGDVIGIDWDAIPMSQPDAYDDVTQRTDLIPTVSWFGGWEGKLTAACKNMKAGATRMYVGGVDDEASTKYYAYWVLDVASDVMLASGAVHLTGLGNPDEAGRGWDSGRDLRGMAFDGTYYYVSYRPPGTNELHLARFSSFPDSTASDSAHPEVPQIVRIDDPAGGVAWPTTNRPDHGGLACGRIVNGDPVFYVLCESYLYTLAPVVPVDMTGVEEDWQDYK